MTTDSGGKAQRAVHEIALEQGGYFTVAQARRVGVSSEVIGAMKRRGNIERISTGVYRIAGYPISHWDQYMAASLWPETRREGVRGTISHASALSMYEISDANPQKIHITIPKTVRIRRRPPPYMVLHRADLAPAEVREMNGIPVTNPERTIRDCHLAHMGSAIIKGAISDAVREGWLKAEAARSLEIELLSEVTH